MAITITFEDIGHPDADFLVVRGRMVVTSGTTSKSSIPFPSQINNIDRVIGNFSYSIDASGNTFSIANVPGNGSFDFEVIGQGL